jgi:L-ascorbate metabolism protein UlaG (beta-lactamase superfamily)
MGEEVSRVGPDIALLPINGRDQEREAEGIVGNLGPAEAAALADGIGAEILVPIHYDMFANNLGHPEAVLHTLQERHPRIALVLPSRHQPIVLAARPRSRGHND